MSITPVDLYNEVHADFGSTAEAAVRQAAYGEDIGQSSWRTAPGLQRFLTCVHALTGERRLARFCYVAQKPGADAGQAT